LYVWSDNSDIDWLQFLFRFNTLLSE